jgi:hypothetical protein
MPACLRGIFVCFGFVIHDPFQPLAGFFGEFKKLGLLSPAFRLGKKLNGRKAENRVTDSFYGLRRGILSIFE